MQFQFLPENSYYLTDQEPAIGGFRCEPGSTVATLRASRYALDALDLLAQALTLEVEHSNDPKSHD